MVVDHFLYYFIFRLSWKQRTPRTKQKQVLPPRVNLKHQTPKRQQHQQKKLPRSQQKEHRVGEMSLFQVDSCKKRIGIIVTCHSSKGHQKQTESDSMKFIQSA